MAHFEHRIEEILEEFRERYTEQVMENIAFRAIYRVKCDLKLDRRPTLEEFKFAFTKEAERQVVHESAFRLMDEVNSFGSMWSGGHSITNMLEQEKRTIIAQTFAGFLLGEKLERKVKEILEQGETK